MALHLSIIPYKKDPPYRQLKNAPKYNYNFKNVQLFTPIGYPKVSTLIT